MSLLEGSFLEPDLVYVGDRRDQLPVFLPIFDAFLLMRVVLVRKLVTSLLFWWRLFLIEFHFFFNVSDQLKLKWHFLHFFVIIIIFPTDHLS